MRAFPDAARRGIRAVTPITRLLSHSDQSAPRALRHGIQLGLLRPIVGSRSAGIAEFPSSQHTGGHALSSLRAKAIQPFRWAVCSYMTPPAFALQLYDRNRATDQHPRSARSPWTDNDSVGQRASRLPTSGAPTSAPTTRGSSRNGDQETGDGAIASVSSREALAPAAMTSSSP
jgi:hypothetical protein